MTKIVWVKPPEINNNLTDTTSNLIVFIISLGINAITAPFVIAWIATSYIDLPYRPKKKIEKKSEIKVQDPTVEAQPEEPPLIKTNPIYNLDSLPESNTIYDLATLERWISKTPATSPFGISHLVVTELFFHINKLITSFYKDNIDDSNISSLLAYGARLIISIEHTDENLACLYKCSDLVNQGRRSNHKYSTLCNEVRSVISTKVKNQYDQNKIHNDLVKLQNTCNKEKLKYPKNIIISEYTNVKVNPPTKKNKLGKKITLYVFGSIVLFTLYYLFLH